MSVAALLRRVWPADLLWFHVPNGELRDKATAAKLVGMGVRRGVPDFAFIMPNAQAAFLELKAADGVLSDEQAVFRDIAIACGCGYATARSMEEVDAVLTRWLAAYDLKPRATMMRRAG